ncbi:bifunctional [glutamate--ammonia ligase]-adenylyl-L-tyrosine phosphorylase/[glutamate--ammonia-ligase] adenylyltransferase [Xanthomonas campestris pv. uppalii]|uniref:bifunctional [glutamate--ammonia ligase]-adenylyl-L-tyrosine phosphorylase/[glutamate--ammonia-ligase] adenylyltransferase n=1 Tax=Xanthomonas euvesicatoria TaxID=456327 RepID=UPI001C4874FB|nr:bifunctional [glutamate--ammonia ligase]-adenylyl-L-tyrosine phosphorylase/[glutamate--ammonia-ligase] adenylyltransferase [Xanthomonas euvesicatoria]MBV6784739.1 bifunctional [glutamate--ammonia ligase]-adenylyl-L-tyrosine phosphorylase/[glutamate--ammonia-ligase] adenylyltransferase [Xanthomonas campestris pv. uppalii]MBV6797743.1 bifunctional [glutamate--ammonia ligase]-adenylyl-L-tyrosine phosphorylase/[glutamate--ammonia-ligase] adenylyltransferase [Xanthomonas campestris pv. obscurae]
MPMPTVSMSPALTALIERAVARVRQSLPVEQAWPGGAFDRQLAQVALASEFALDTLARQPALLQHLAQPDPPPLPLPQLDPAQPPLWPAQLRRYRSAESTRLVWRDVLGLDSVEATMAGATRLAEHCLQCGLQALEQQFHTRHGKVIAADGSVQRLVVFGLGKLGGGELNFSSDVDLVYAYPQGGQSDGARPLAAEEYFARLGQQLARLLDETTADGFSHRVDLRLRPFGTAGRVALSFAGMDQYFQREGRDWERYAWLKARAVAGDIDAGEAWLETLRPFVYRRYLDFTALDGLREMKAAITAEVARHDRLDDIKRGPGGIREIEFLAQSLQLIRGGREPSLRERRLLPALQALVAAGQIDQENGQALSTAYRFLRRLENRLQMLHDAQTHALPQAPLDRERIALGLGYADWSALLDALAPQRTRVAAEFAELLAPRVRATAPDALADYWRALPEGDAAPLAGIGLHDPDGAHQALADFAQSSGVRALSDSARARLDRVMPALLHAATRASQPDAAVRRMLGLLQATLRRTSYLALLDEQPSALARLVDVLSRSALLAERLAAYPLLLDELLDTRISGPLPDRAALHAACAETLHIDDTEAALRELNERRLALSFRIALATLDGRQQAVESTRQLAWLAEAVVQTVLHLARSDMLAAHGHVPGGSFAIVGYGSLGGLELGFGSDLDLVFLYDHPPEVDASDGKRPLEAGRWFARLAQKVMALLAAETGAGRLYDIDVRLRPDGGKGALVSSLASYRDYQRDRAWTWEHQALVRARAVAGDAALCDAFARVRRDTLMRVRDTAQLHEDVRKMRARMRAELDRSDAGRLDLKQGAGGLVDLEFVLQAGVLGLAAQQPQLLDACDTPALIDALARTHWLPDESGAPLHQAHATLVDAGLSCTLDRRPRLLAPTPAIQQARGIIFNAARGQGLTFPLGKDETAL